MKRYKVTGTVAVRKRLSALEELSLVDLEDDAGCALVAADLLGVAPGDQVIVSTTGAQAILGANLPVDALVLCTLDAPLS